MENLAELQTASKSAFTEFNVRQEQGKPHFVRLHDSVVKRLEGQLEQHQCGLLLGSIEPGEGCTIAVEDFEPAVQIEERIKTWRAQAGSGRQLVGYYHAHSRSGFALDAAERTLFERCFPKEQRLVLLVKPPTAEVGTAIFFLGEGGQLLADRATVEFPFNLRELGAEDAPEPVATAKPIIAVAKAVAPAAQAAVAPVKAAAPAVKPATAPVKTTSPVAQPAPAPVKATATLAPEAAASPRRTGLLWKIAIAGVVVIASGFGLSELKVFDRHTAPEQPVSVAVENSAPAITPAEKAPPAVEAESSKLPIPVPQKAEPARPAPVATKPASPILPQKTAPQPATPAAQPIVVAQNPVPAPTAPIQPLAELPKPTPLADPPPAIRKEAPPTQVAPPPAVVPSAPVVAITPPHAIQQVAPELPGKALKSLVGEVVVRLKVNVDASGRVTSTESAGGASVDPAVMSAVSSAVKRWKFEPARQGSEKVPGELVLSFVFRK
jgi:protein TonB